MTDTKAAALDMLRKHCGTARVRIEFSGGGDSGAIDEIAVDGLLSENELRKLPVTDEVIIAYSGRDPKDVLDIRRLAPMWSQNIYSFLDEWVYELLRDAVDFDWVNNDGGRGTVIIEPFSGKITIEAEEYFTDSREHSYDLSIDPPKDVTEQVDG